MDRMGLDRMDRARDDGEGQRMDRDWMDRDRDRMDRDRDRMEIGQRMDRDLCIAIDEDRGPRIGWIETG